MAFQKSPHTQSEQNTRFERTGINPDLERRLAEGDESDLPEHYEGEQIDGTRSPRRTPVSGPEHKTRPTAAAFEGSVKTRTPSDSPKQGISSHIER